jgi:CRISPR-associated exonuclease Cas4
MSRATDALEQVMVSALQHYVYCPRQCALIHVDDAWQENIFTMRGKRAHENVDIPDGMTRDGIRIEWALPIWSDTIGLVGRADVVEFSSDGTPYPVEHKVGPRKYRKADEVQLCAQALCLEEMLDMVVPEGALYYRKSRRRRPVTFGAELKSEVVRVASEVRELIEKGTLPPPVADTRCTYCSLLDICLPHVSRLTSEVYSE